MTTSSEHDMTTKLEDSHAKLLKDADKLKLMLLAWNYQNATAQNGSELESMTKIWEQYQNALLGINQAINNPENAETPVS